MGEIVKPDTEEEKQCFKILDDLDHIGSHVKGSITNKKYMRNEIWSLVAFKGAPSWFITFSPADNKHPICLYYADKDIKFRPEIRSSAVRDLLVLQNPIAAARFFDYLVKMTIKHVLGVGSDHAGLYGNTSAYYGTVEQQGRLTLHMHMLLWIDGALSPQDIRDRIMKSDSKFQLDLVKYLESCHIGQFITGNMNEIAVRTPRASDDDPNYHSVIPLNPSVDIDPNYKNPTETLPLSPPPRCQAKHTMDQSDISPCMDCDRLADWWSQFENTTDNLLYKSNIHTCRQSNPKKTKPKKGETMTKDGETIGTESIPNDTPEQNNDTKAARNGP